MFTKCYSSLLIFSLSASTLMALSSSSWLLAWFSLEINLMSFVPLMIMSHSPFTSEASIKYFLTQALASTMILFSGLLMLKSLTVSDFFYPNSLITTALGVKSGMAPTHFWFPQVMELINWNNGAILLTWQKIAPLTLLFSANNLFILFIFIVSSSVVGPLGGFNLNSLKKIMAYSSISHLAWMASSTFLNFKLWGSYFLVYSCISLSLIITLWNLKIYSINMINTLTSNKMFSSILFINLLSLGGMPPFTGIFPKILLVMGLFNMNAPQTFMLMFLISSSVVTLFFYIKVIYSVMMTNNFYSSVYSSNKINWTTPVSWLISLTVIGNVAFFPLVLLM